MAKRITEKQKHKHAIDNGKAIGRMLRGVDTDYRGNALQAAAIFLQETFQMATAKMIQEVAVKYGIKSEPDNE